MELYHSESPLLDIQHPSIVELVAARGWAELPEGERIRSAYNFVRDEILFGYNVSDDLPGSAVLKDGYGQCNTKATLLMTLLRSLRIPCRLHGFTIHKELQAGAIPELFYELAPDEILHSWVETCYGGQWVNLEGFILDSRYLAALRQSFADVRGPFCGFAVATPDLHAPPNEWSGGDTYIQKEAIVKDLGIFDSPDDFYAKHGSNLQGWRDFIFSHVVRKIMNSNIEQIRAGKMSMRQRRRLKPHDHPINLTAPSPSVFSAIPESDWSAANEFAFAIPDRYPVNPGHTLIITKRPIPSWFDASDDEKLAIFELIDEVKNALDRELKPDGYNVGFNDGLAAGQTITHLHVHIIPRFQGDITDPRGGVRHVIPARGNYLKEMT